MTYLGKWPTMRVVGKPVSRHQAGDILICTTNWFDYFPKGSGWEHDVRVLASRYGMPMQPIYDKSRHDEWFQETWHVWRPEFQKWCQTYGVMELNDFDGPGNDLITGSHRAWCNWDGEIAGQFNIGKDPSEFSVRDFFREVAHRFPFLDMTVDLISEHKDQRGDTSSEEGYTKASRLTIRGGGVHLNEQYEGDALVLPESWIRWQEGLNRMDERGVTPARLREAFEHLTA